MDEYKRQFEEASKPDAIDLVGRWRVKVRSGVLPDTSHLGHIKIIKRNGKWLRGHNRTAYIPWGYFHIRYNTSNPASVLFVYDAGHFIDEVRKINADSLIGIYRLSTDRDIELSAKGYFTMERVK